MYDCSEKQWEMTKPETNWDNVISISDDFQSDTNWQIGNCLEFCPRVLIK